MGIYDPEYLILPTKLAGDLKFSSEFFVESFCGIPLEVDWEAEPNTIKLYDVLNGNQLMAVINVEEPNL